MIAATTTSTTSDDDGLRAILEKMKTMTVQCTDGSIACDAYVMIRSSGIVRSLHEEYGDEKTTIEFPVSTDDVRDAIELVHGILKEHAIVGAPRIERCLAGLEYLNIGRDVIDPHELRRTLLESLYDEEIGIDHLRTYAHRFIDREHDVVGFFDAVTSKTNVFEDVRFVYEGLAMNVKMAACLFWQLSTIFPIGPAFDVCLGMLVSPTPLHVVALLTYYRRPGINATPTELHRIFKKVSRLDVMREADPCVFNVLGFAMQSTDPRRRCALTNGFANVTTVSPGCARIVVEANFSRDVAVHLPEVMISYTAANGDFWLAISEEAIGRFDAIGARVSVVMRDGTVHERVFCGRKLHELPKYAEVDYPIFFELGDFDDVTVVREGSSARSLADIFSPNSPSNRIDYVFVNVYNIYGGA